MERGKSFDTVKSLRYENKITSILSTWKTLHEGKITTRNLLSLRQHFILFHFYCHWRWVSFLIYIISGLYIWWSPSSKGEFQHLQKAFQIQFCFHRWNHLPSVCHKLDIWEAGSKFVNYWDSFNDLILIRLYEPCGTQKRVNVHNHHTVMSGDNWGHCGGFLQENKGRQRLCVSPRC